MAQYLGMVHGRFQPFHREHLGYVSMGLDRCHYLVIGITNPDPAEYQADSTSSYRHLYASNPFTYFQRAEMIRYSMFDLGVDLQRISIVPFHLFDRHKWLHYLPNPSATVQYVRIFSAWEEKKVALFREHGFKVEILDKGSPKNIEGIQVRRVKQMGGNWRALVPDGTARVIDMIEKGRL